MCLGVVKYLLRSYKGGCFGYFPIENKEGRTCKDVEQVPLRWKLKGVGKARRKLSDKLISCCQLEECARSKEE